MASNLFSQAEQIVAEIVMDSDVDFGLISDTGTVDNLVENGYSLRTIAAGDIPHNVVLDNIAWLD